MSNVNCIIMDTETTGLDAETDRLVEIAGARLSDLKSFETLVDPQRDVPPEARAIHHIGPADVVGAPDEVSALRAMFTSLNDLNGQIIFAAHNAKFDRGFINRIAPALSLDWICTYKCAVVTWPDAPAHGNQVLRYYLGLDVDKDLPPGLFPHRALYDVIVTRGILIELLKVHSLEKLINISNNPVLLTKVSFGKHKGQLWSEVPFGYLKWCVGQADMNEDVLHTAAHWMRKR